MKAIQKDFIFEVLGESREVIVSVDTWEEAVAYAKKHLDNSGQRLNLEAPKRVEEREVFIYDCISCGEPFTTDREFTATLPIDSACFRKLMKASR